jgi:hypothetical protein
MFVTEFIGPHLNRLAVLAGVLHLVPIGEDFTDLLGSELVELKLRARSSVVFSAASAIRSSRRRRPICWRSGCLAVVSRNALRVASKIAHHFSAAFSPTSGRSTESPGGSSIPNSSLTQSATCCGRVVHRKPLHDSDLLSVGQLVAGFSPRVSLASAASVSSSRSPLCRRPVTEDATGGAVFLRLVVDTPTRWLANAAVWRNGITAAGPRASCDARARFAFPAWFWQRRDRVYFVLSQVRVRVRALRRARDDKVRAAVAAADNPRRIDVRTHLAFASTLTISMAATSSPIVQ